jgi:hypothetical protein
MSGFIPPKNGKKTAQKITDTACSGEKNVIFECPGGFFCALSHPLLTPLRGGGRLPRNARIEKIVFLQQSGRKFSPDSQRAIILKAFVYLYEKFH